MTVTRPDLIDAAAKALADADTNGICGESWPQPCDGCDCFRPQRVDQYAAMDRSRAEHVLSQVLPLIADLIDGIGQQLLARAREADLKNMPYTAAEAAARGRGAGLARDLVRGLAEGVGRG